LQIAKVKMDLAKMQYDAIHEEYEALKTQLVSEMVNDNINKFELASIDDADIPGLSFSLTTVERWSPVVENKDKLYSKLITEAPDLFTVSAATLSSYISDLKKSNNDILPSVFDGLVKKYDDTHVNVRTKRIK